MITLSSELKDKQQIIEQGIAIYRRTLWQILPFSFLAVFFTFLPSFIFILPGIKTATTGQLLGTHCVCWVIAFTFFAALIFRLYCLSYHIPNTFIRSLKHALFKLIPLLLLVTLYSLIILSGTMLLVIPGIILSVSLMFSFYILITDNQNILQTLTSSHRLVWDHWWDVTLCLAIPFLLNIVVSLLILFIVIGSSMLVKENAFLSYFSLFFLNILIQTFLVPFTFSIMLALFHDLRLRQTLQQPTWY